jgi:ribonuclease HI
LFLIEFKDTKRIQIKEMSPKPFVLPISDEKRKLKELKYILYTDGSCDNLGTRHGGWASYILDPKDNGWLISGDVKDTTSNRMELQAIIEGLEWILQKYDEATRRHVKVTLYCDSKYCVNLINEWIQAWKEKNLLDERPNVDLILQLNKQRNSCQLFPHWIPRNSCEFASLCDKTANERREDLKTN